MATTPNVLTQQDLEYASGLLQQSNISGMYDYLAQQGYKYAVLANGVARGDTFAGLMALEFMENTAAAQGQTLSQIEIDAIRRDMASGYLSALQQQITAQGAVTRETPQMRHGRFTDRYTEIRV